MDDPAFEWPPKLSDFAPLIGWGLALAITIVLTKALIAAFPSVDQALLLISAGLPVATVFYGWARWWRKRHA